MTSSQIIRIYDVKLQFLERVKHKYKVLAAYKLAESYTSYGEEILCDLVTIGLLGLSFQYGLQMKLHGRGTAVIATSIFLLMNLSQVLKSIVKLTINLQTFFAINMVQYFFIIGTFHVICDRFSFFGSTNTLTSTFSSPSNKI